MFVKKDLRKIREIIADAADERTQLKLARRPPEFSGNLKALCRRSWFSSGAFRKLEYLSLYGNELNSVEGIGMFSATPLKRLNLGGNKINVLPVDFGTLIKLEELWIDDNNLKSFPQEILQLISLRILRLSGNKITLLPTAIAKLECLEELALDRNMLASLPSEIGQLAKLENLQIGGNLLSEIPASIGCILTLRSLNVSSNKMSKLPDLRKLSNLQELHAGANELKMLPDEFLDMIAPKGSLKLVFFPNNSITLVRPEWTDIANSKEDAGKGDGVQLVLEGNPLVAPTAHPSKYEELSEIAYTQPISVTYKKQKT